MLVVAGRVLSYTCDWMSLSSTTDEEEGADNWLWRTCMRKIDTGGHKNYTKEVKFGGYAGYTWSDGKEKVGQRMRDGKIDVLYQVSGGLASIESSWFESEGVLSREDVKVTRFDEQVTVKLERRDPHIAQQAYNEIMSSKSRGESLTGRRKVVLYRSAAGDTLNVGSRASRGNFFRIYDKSRDMDFEPGTAWRFEVERGRETAGRGMASFYAPETINVKIAELSQEFLVACALSWQYRVMVDRTHRPTMPDGENGTTEKDRLSKWLVGCVRRPVSRMIALVGIDDTLALLGLSDEVEKLFHVKQFGDF